MCSRTGTQRPVSEWLGLRGQRVLIAGGGGTIGEALVDGFLSVGSSVGVIDLDPSGMSGRVTATYAADLSEPAAARAAVAQVRDTLGGLDVFVHCVGINE